jgi:prepilin-type N-terminal cleavage/methylation domain-containing protein/prepilin-type processing-associated H-X9-DG protein
MKRSAENKRGFTLVELLVVIGIIAILISVLLPVLGSARKTANKVKCASQLREIGNALKLYQNEYKGYWPIVQHQSDPTFPPSDNGMKSPVARNDYWYMFLLKYFTNRAYTNTSGKRLVDFMNTPLFGCPSVDKTDFDASTSSAEFNSGYGMGPYALYGKRTFLGVNSGPAPGYSLQGQHWAFCASSNNTQGKYFKMTQWVGGAEKAIITDSRSWFNETRSVANLAGVVHPNPEAAHVGYDGAASHQLDRWRHSKRRGGKQPYSMNFLFCDGHGHEVTSIEEAFTAIRGHFPQ